MILCYYCLYCVAAAAATSSVELLFLLWVLCYCCCEFFYATAWLGCCFRSPKFSLLQPNKYKSCYYSCCNDAPATAFCSCFGWCFFICSWVALAYMFYGVTTRLFVLQLRGIAVLACCYEDWGHVFDFSFLPGWTDIISKNPSAHPVRCAIC